MIKSIQYSQKLKEENNQLFQSLKAQTHQALKKIGYLIDALSYDWQSKIQTSLHTQFSQLYDFQFSQIIHSKTVNPSKHGFWRSSIQTKHNWISHYLDDITKSTTVIGRYKNQLVKIENYDQITHTFGIKKYLQNNESQSNYNNFQNEQITRIKNIALNQSNKQLFLEFRQHQNMYKLNSRISKIQITQNSRVLFKKEDDGIKRIIIFKCNQSKYSNSPYQYLDGKTSQRQFIWPVLLNSGNYILYIPEEQQNFTNNLTMITKEPVLVLTPKQNLIQTIQEYNLMVSAFKQKDEFNNKNTLSFIRANYLDAGIVLQITKNLYFDSVQYINQKQGEQDKKMMFSSIYRQNLTYQLKDCLLPRQKIIKFHKLTKLPARLYIPQKKIIIGQEQISCHSYHTVIE